MSDSVRPHWWQPTRLPCPWNYPGKNAGVGCHFLLQCMKVKSESEVARSCPTVSDPMDCSLPGSSVHGIFQAGVLFLLILIYNVFFFFLTSVCFIAVISNTKKCTRQSGGILIQASKVCPFRRDHAEPTPPVVRCSNTCAVLAQRACLRLRSPEFLFGASLIEFFFLIDFLLGGNCVTMLCWFLPYNSAYQP